VGARGLPVEPDVFLVARAHPGGARAVGAALDPGGVTIFQALEKQLGLKVEKGTYSVPVIVIDSMEQKPID